MGVGATTGSRLRIRHEPVGADADEVLALEAIEHLAREAV